jgi:hypothetical protein
MILMNLNVETFFQLHILKIDLVQWSEFSSITQEVAGSSPVQYKHLCACLFVLIGSGFFFIFVFSKKST